MFNNELNKLIDKLKIQGTMYFLEATTKEKIESFEKDKSVKLPEQYKEWLLYSDGGELFLPAGVQLYGIEHKPVIDVDDNSRPDNSYIVIGALATGDPVLCSKDNDKISIYNQEVGVIEDDEVYDDFYSFLNDLYNLLGIGD